jgi:hypothetical protein
LNSVADLGVEAIDAGIDIVLKQLTKSSPKGGGGGGMAENKIKNLGGNMSVDPLYNGEIILDPTRIIGARNRIGSNMVEKIAMAEVNIKKMTPMIVVVGGEI